MSDLEALRDAMRRFSVERDWEQFHDPKSLVLALVGEVGELAELMQWLPADEVVALAKTEPLKQRLGEELSDVLLYLLRLADVLDVPLADAATDKLQQAELRFPATDVHGRAPRKAETTGSVLAVVVEDVVDALSGGTRPRQISEMVSAPDLHQPGTYAWHVDGDGAAAITRGLGAAVEAGLVYIGQAGAERGERGSAATLRSRLSQHVRGNVRASTWRRTLAAALHDELQLERDGDRLVGDGESRLSGWMEAHLRWVAVPVDPTALRAVERDVLTRLDPALNLDHVESSPARQRLRARRRG